MLPRSEPPIPLNPADGGNAEAVGKFRESVGDFFVARMQRHSDWVRWVLGGLSDDILICCGTTALTSASCLDLVFTLRVYGRVSMFVHSLALLPRIIQSFSATRGDENHENFDPN